MPRLHGLTEDPAPPRTNVDEFAAFLSSRAEGGISQAEIAEVPPSIICGDTNIESYDELSPLLQRPLEYVDTFSAVHPPSAPTSDLAARNHEIYTTHLTFGTTYTEDPKPVGPKRIDYILAHPGGSLSLRVLGATTLGGEPCRGMGTDGQIYEGRCKGGKGGKMYPSDHLGVIAEMQFLRR